MHNQKKKQQISLFSIFNVQQKNKKHSVNINFKQLKHVGYKFNNYDHYLQKILFKLLKPIIIQWFTKTALLDALLLKLISK